MSRSLADFGRSLTPEQIATMQARAHRRPSQTLLNTERVDVAKQATVGYSNPAIPQPDERKGWPVFEAMLRSNKLPAPLYEFRFDAVRKWRFDMAWPQQRVAIEVNGGVWSEGRHTRGQGYINDMEKINAAQLAGWHVLQYTPDSLIRAVDDLKRMFLEIPHHGSEDRR